MGGHGAEVEVPHDGNDPFVKRVALSVAAFAVVLALAAAGGNNAGKDMLMAQMQASNEWNRYQAKSQREVLYAQEREELEQAFSPLTKEEAEGLAKLYEAGQKDRTKLPSESAERRRQARRAEAEPGCATSGMKGAHGDRGARVMCHKTDT